MTVRRVTAFTVEVEDRPGTLAEMAQPVADAGINLLAVYGGPTSEGRAMICCVPEDPGPLRALAAEGGVPVQERECLLVEGEDRPGAGAELARKLAGAGINIEQMLATASGGTFAACVVVAPGDIDKAAAALGG